MSVSNPQNIQSASRESSGTTLTASSYSVPAGDDKLLVAVVSWESGSVSTLTDITFDGSAGTQDHAFQSDDNAAFLEAWVWAIGSDTPTGDVVVTWPSSISVALLSVFVIEGADQTGSTGFAENQTGYDVTLNSVVADSLLLQHAMNAGGGGLNELESVAPWSETDQANLPGGGTHERATGHRQISSDGSYSSDWANGSSSSRQCGAVVEFPVSSGGGATGLDASSGTLHLVGQAATVNAKTAIAAGAGSLALTGQAASVSTASDTRIDATAGSLQLSAQPAAVNAKTEVAATAGALQLAAQDAGVTAGASTPAQEVFTPGIGLHSIASGPIASRRSTQFSASLGTLQIAGQAAIVNAKVQIAAAVGALQLTGQAASVRAEKDTRLTATAGSLQLQAHPATVRFIYSIPATAGSLALTGQVAGVNVRKRIGAGVGSLLLSGQAASIRIEIDTRIDAALGTLHLTGRKATVATRGWQPESALTGTVWSPEGSQTSTWTAESEL